MLDESDSFWPWLAKMMETHGWLGRMYGARAWLTNAAIYDDQPRSHAMVAIRHNCHPDTFYPGFSLVRQEHTPFQAILVDVLPMGGDRQYQPLARPDGVDIHLVLSGHAPWYTAFNLGAACTNAEIVIFVDGAARPEPGFLAAYTSLFSNRPETVAARGRVGVAGLDDCACQVTGSFVLDEQTTSWPVDLDENMAVRSGPFFALGGFDESMIGGYGGLDWSIRLFASNQDFSSQQYARDARTVLELPDGDGLPMQGYLLQRQRSWLQLNDSLKRYLELYARFWQENSRVSNV